jgi:hypothetical protein
MTSLKHVILGLMIFCITAGCASIETGRQNFKNDRNECVGQIAAMGHRCGWWEPKIVREIGENTDEYVYQSGDCEWAFEIDRKTKVVKSWRYISSPDLCYIEIDWLGAW